MLLGVQPVKYMTTQGKGEAVLFFDSGSTLTLCRHSWAREAGYVGRQILIYMKILTQEYQAVETMEYRIELLNVSTTSQRKFPLETSHLPTPSFLMCLRRKYDGPVVL